MSMSLCVLYIGFVTVGLVDCVTDFCSTTNTQESYFWSISGMQSGIEAERGGRVLTFVI